ncbi:MAG: hypothetical protein E7345_03580 [Clostridiales bacterium]|nr:hypothetical protein [Clostridiales bacterium]
MKKFIVYLLVIVFTVSLGFAVFFLVRNDEVITISATSMYVDKGENFNIDITHENKKSYTEINISSSNENIVSYDKDNNNFIAVGGGVARINFRTSNVNFRNLSCDVIVGDGTINSPYYIDSAEQLACIGMGEQLTDEEGNLTQVFAGKEPYTQYHSNKYYKLINNIDVSEINGGYWVPLRKFSGSLDGNGSTISKINIDIDSYKSLNDGKNGLFGTDNVGFFSEIMQDGIVYNLKFENFGASGKYTNFGIVAGTNKGVVERIEVKDTFISVESDVFGGLVGINETTDDGENDTYTRHIARVECSNVNLNLGQKYAEGSDELVVQGAEGVIGGLVGINNGGVLSYSYAVGDIYFGSGANRSIVYGGLIGQNNAKQFSKVGGEYNQFFQGANIKDSYSSINTYLLEANSTGLYGGVIGINKDISLGKYEEDSEAIRVSNYFAGVRYDKTKLNLDNGIDGFEKKFSAIAKNYIGEETQTFVEDKTTILGLKTEEMLNKENFVSYIENYNADGSLLEESQDVLWAFDNVWGIDVEKKVNNGMPYLNYTIVNVADYFRLVGVPVIENNTYKFAYNVDLPIVITSGANGYLEIKLGESYNLQLSPYEAMKGTKWTSSDDKVVSVEESTGKITGIATGLVTITAEYKNGSVDSIRVRVKSDDVYTIYGLTAISMEVGETTQISGYTVTLNGVEQEGLIPTFMSDSDIISVTSTGKITAKKVGVAEVEAIVGTCREVIKVNVFDSGEEEKKIVNVLFKQTQFIYNYSSSPIEGKIIVTSALCDGVDIKDQITYKFECDTGIVTVDTSKGQLTAEGYEIPFTVKGIGRCIITCTVLDENHYSNASSINIYSKAVETDETLELDVKSISLKVGTSHQLIATGFANKNVTYSSSASSIATVDNGGNITAIREGVATIYATITLNNGTKITQNCIVSVWDDSTIGYEVKVDGKTLGKDGSKYKVNTGDIIEIYANTTYSFVGNETFSWSLLNNDGEAETMSITGSYDSILKIKCLSEGTFKVKLRANGRLSVNISIQIEDDYAYEQTYTKYITNAMELDSIRYHLDKDFVIMKNIDMKDWEEWTPIGTVEKPFTGTLTVEYGEISNLSIKGDYTSAGLFGYVKDAKISGVVINGIGINASKYAGGIVGYMTGNSVIDNSYVTNVLIHAVNGEYYAGGIVGYANSGEIANVKTISMGLTTAKNTVGYAGGIAGKVIDANITNAKVQDVNIIANTELETYAGGIVGYTMSIVSKGIVSNSSVVGYYVGGVAGVLNSTEQSTVKFKENIGFGKTRAYIKSEVSSASYSTTISEVAVHDNVTIKGVNVGGLVGVIDSGVVYNSYTMAKLIGANNSSIVAGFTAELKRDSNFGKFGGTGHVGIIEYCYTSCTFEGNGKHYSTTGSKYVHRWMMGASEKYSSGSGYMFNYVFEKVKGVENCTNSWSAIPNDADKTSAKMLEKTTYTDKNFSSVVWDLTDGGYPTLKFEK